MAEHWYIRTVSQEVYVGLIPSSSALHLSPQAFQRSTSKNGKIGAHTTRPGLSSPYIIPCFFVIIIYCMYVLYLRTIITYSRLDDVLGVGDPTIRLSLWLHSTLLIIVACVCCHETPPRTVTSDSDRNSSDPIPYTICVRTNKHPVHACLHRIHNAFHS